MQDIFGNLFDEVSRAWRYRWFGLWTACVLAGIGTVISILLPNYYTSHAKIYLNTESLLQPLLEGIAVESNLRGQLDLVQRTLLSDPNLEGIVHTVDTGFGARTAAGLEEAKSSLRRRIVIEVENENLFSVTYDDTRPQRAHDVVNALLKIFIQTGVSQSFAESQGAREFIDQQISDYEAQLRKTELALAKYRVIYPDMVGTEGISTRLDTARAAVATAQLDYRQAIAWRDQMAAQLRAMEAGKATDASAGQPIDDQRITAAVNRINTLRAELEALRGTYTENHPDVVSRRRELESLVSQFAAGGQGPSSATVIAPGSPAAGGVSADGTQGAADQQPRIDDMRIRLILAEAGVLTSERVLERAQTDLRSLEAVAGTAGGNNQLAKLTRDYQVMRDSYNELLKRRESARISQAVGTAPGAIPYRVVEAPSVPKTPSRPNRPLWLAVSSLGALVGGAVAAFLRALNAGTFLRPEEIEMAFGLPVAGAVSRIDSMLTKVGRTAEKTSFLLGLGGLVVALAMLIFITSQFDAWREQAYRLFESITQLSSPSS